MDETTRPATRPWDGLLARLLYAQLLARGVANGHGDHEDECIWPARLIHAGLALSGAGTLVLASWPRRHR